MEDGQFERLLAEFAESRRHTDQRFDEALRHTDQRFAEARLYTNEATKSLREEIQDARREFRIVEEALRSEIRLVAEGVAMVDGKVDRLGVELRAEIKAESTATRDLLRLSFSDLDRRVTRIEGELSI